MCDNPKYTAAASFGAFESILCIDFSSFLESLNLFIFNVIRITIGIWFACYTNDDNCSTICFAIDFMPIDALDTIDCAINWYHKENLKKSITNEINEKQKQKQKNKLIR